MHMRFSAIIPSFLQRLIWIPTRLSLAIFCHLEVKGIENIKTVKGNVILASNHISELDPVIIAGSLPFFSRHLPVFYTSREKDFYKDMGWKKIIYGGKFFKMWGAYPAYTGLNNYDEALKHHIEITKMGKTISIFPTGKRTRLGEKTEAKGGVGFLARTTQLPIVPILIEGAESITAKDFLLNRRKIKITFGKSLYTKDIFENNHSNYKIAAEEIIKKITQLA